jgi:D-3-phosphoglycerate dehydrogenase / 2-oxoglutarate reductase
MKIAILDDWFNTLPGLASFAKLAGKEVTVFTDHLTDEAALVARLAPFDAVVLFRERTAMQASLLRRLPRLRLVALRGVYPHVDVQCCTDLGITVSANTSSSQPSYAAAELTIALILASLRQIPAQMASLQAGRWQMAVGHTLRGKTVGIFGYGKIGRTVAQYAKVFGTTVLVWGRELALNQARSDGFEIAQSKVDFFSRADIVSLHLRLVADTKAIVTAQDLALMKPTALLVNTSRAGLVATGALVAALKNGRPGMAALDVFDHEPLIDPADPLLSMPNVVCTPHLGFVTREELDMQFNDIYDQINAFASGKPIHVVNPTFQPRQ